MKLHSIFVWAAILAAPAVTGRPAAFADDKLDPTGTWTWTRSIEGRSPQSVVKLIYKDGKLTGTYKRLDQEVPIVKGKFEKGIITFEAEGTWDEQKLHGKFRGKLSRDKIQGDSIQGDIELTIGNGEVTFDWFAKRGIDYNAIVGEWNLKVVAQGNTYEPTLKLSTDEDGLAGKYTGRMVGEVDATDVRLNGMELTWKVDTERDGTKFKVTYKGKPEGNAIKGTLDYDFAGNVGSGEFTGQRIADAAGKKIVPTPSKTNAGASP